jgi:hypothetical protein
MSLADLAAAVISEARQMSGLTTPAFDYDIKIHGIGGASGPLGGATYTIATRDLPAVRPGDPESILDERKAIADKLWADLQPELRAYEQRCQNREFAGWSTAARDRGQHIRYAS